MSIICNNKKAICYRVFNFGEIARRVSITVLLMLVLFTGFNNSLSAQEKTGKIQLNFKDAPVETVLSYLSETAGLIVVYEYELKDRISVISKQPLDTQDAVSLINTLLKEKGFTAILMGKTLKVVPLTEAIKMNIPVRTGSDPDRIIPGDDVVTFIIPVKYAKATSLQETLATLISDTADFKANDDTNTLILTDTTANIKRILEIIKSIDTHVATISELKVFHLQYAEAESTAELINELFEEQGQSNRSSGGRGIPSILQMIGRGGLGGGPPMLGGPLSSSGGGEGSALAANITAKADERTNSVVVSAPQDSMEVIAKLIKDLDSDSSEGRSVFVYALKNAKADNLKEVLTNLFNEMSSSSGTTGAFGGMPGQNGRGTGRMPSLFGMTQQNDSGSGDLAGDVYLEADKDTNSLIIMTSPPNYEKIKRVLDELDKPVPQVLIKVLLAEVTHDGGVEWGSEFSFLDTLSGDVGISITTSDFGVGSQTNGYIATLENAMNGKFNLKLRALEKEGKLNILSRPYILASNNQTAKITVGNEVPFIRDTRTTETGQTINTIEYEDIGIILEVTPYINEEGLVIMDLSQEISAISGESVPISETVDASVFAKRSSENRVIARDGQTVVIGGLMEDRLTKTVRKVPLLGDIPLLGMLFRGIKEDTAKTELLIFLTPTVAKSDKELVEITKENRDKNVLIKEVYNKDVFIHP